MDFVRVYSDGYVSSSSNNRRLNVQNINDLLYSVQVCKLTSRLLCSFSQN